MNFANLFSGEYWATYGGTWLTLVIAGIILGFIIEITLKKYFNSRIEKAGEDEAKVKKIQTAKARVSLYVAIGLSFVLGFGIVENMPLPCGEFVGIFLGVAAVYTAQYITNLVIIPGIVEFISKPRAEKKHYKTFEVDEEGNPIQ